VARYASRLSGPLLDRIDLHVSVPGVPWAELDRPAAGPGSRVVRERVVAARERQVRRLRDTGACCNATIPDSALESRVDATPDARALLGRAVERLRLSARAARRVLRVARTIADLGADPRVGPSAIAEALGYRDDAFEASGG
jgi:magnesium chelatase family protein